MKRRTLKALALIATLTVGLSGCSLLAPVATTHPYDPSDGVGTTVANVDVRNLLLVGEEGGRTFNAVFTAVNRTEKKQRLEVIFAPEGGTEQAYSVTVKPGSTKFGSLKDRMMLLDIPKLKIGSTIKTYVRAGNAKQEMLYVPVLDGTLKEYQDYMFRIETEEDL